MATHAKVGEHLLATDDNQKDSKALTREQYRKLKQQQDDDFKQRDKRRVQVERQYAKEHQQDYNQDVPDEPQSAELTDDFKTFRWKKTNRRLNWTISVLLFLILIVYLVLFFVN